MAARLHHELHLHPEVRRPDLGVRPDFAARLGNRQDIIGYLELKRPDHAVTRAGLRGRDLRQWETMTRLANVLYTNGVSWVLYRHGEAVHTVHLQGDLSTAGKSLSTPDTDGASFLLMVQEFLMWQPKPIESVRDLVKAAAPLCRLLKEEVIEQLAFEAQLPLRESERGPSKWFTALARDWEQILFPRESEESNRLADFADRYAQAVTHSLILARVEGIDIASQSLHEVGRLLGAEHTVMGRSLQILTDQISEQFGNCLDMLVKIIGAVRWETIREREPDAHVHLYENFLEEYDSKLRRKSGTYYTPVPLVEHMVRLTEEVLESRLGRSRGLADSQVTIVDPAMGSGSFLSAVIDRVAGRWQHEDDGERVEALDSLARRLVGFENQMGAFAVAEMRVTQALYRQKTRLHLKDMHLHLADTLSDPWGENSVPDLGAVYADLIADRRLADRIKQTDPVTVVVGNPPFVEKASGKGGWIESGSRGHAQAAELGGWFLSEYSTPGEPLLDGFRLRGNDSVYENKLRSQYVYFWRWATYKVFEQHRAQQQQGVGIVCFVSMAGFLRGRGFKGMRNYLRRTCSEGWIIDLTPEGQQPPISTRFFPGVQQELAVAIFVRKANTSAEELAHIHYTALTGSRESKYQQLSELTLDGRQWKSARNDPYSDFTGAPQSCWDECPALDELLPWTRTGVTPSRTWVYAPDEETLILRWRRLMHETDPIVKAELFKETRDRTLSSVVEPLPGHAHAPYSLKAEKGDCLAPVQVCLRSFDRQWVIPDSRLLDMPRPDLWRAVREDQVFILERNSHRIERGPALVFSSLIPDKNAFRGSGGGRVLPLRHADGTANVTPGLLQHLANSFQIPEVTADDLAAYIAAITAHPAFTARFADELNTPGIRVPLTGHKELWSSAVSLGRRVIWAATFGERYADSGEGRPAGSDGLRRTLPEPILYRPAINIHPLPSKVAYDSSARILWIGTGAFHNVTQRMRHYAVDGREVIDRWLSSRGSRPTGRVGSGLDLIRSENWRSEWSDELICLLSVLRHLTELESAQEGLLDRVLEQPLISRSELTRRRILPAPPHAAKPRQPASDQEILPGMAEHEGQERHEVQQIPPPQELKPVNEVRPGRIGKKQVPGRPRRHRGTR
ncbi:type ISP restriction/modification enzyme [Streptomyces sp. NPDC058420]|uniref:type ISP restriction/modification enzyme n=1 Tax=Streptomyces sp. NPDC058420 TaxID=3346489 RepID=UPI0036646A0D